MEKPLVVFLAGGVGKRFSPLSTSKTLIPFMGKPYFQYVCEMLESAGLTDILAVTNSANNEAILRYGNKLGIKTKTQDIPQGMADAVLTLESEIGSRPILIINGVDLVDPTYLQGFLTKAENTYALIAGRRSKSYFPGGYLEVEGDKLRSIVEKPAPENIPSDIVSLVFDYFKNPQDFIAALKSTAVTTDDRFEQALNKLCKEKEVSFLAYEGDWVTLKFPFHVLDVTSYLLKKVRRNISSSASISEKAVINGEVVIEEGVKIFDGAVIQGPTYIGKNVIIGNNTLVRESMIEEGSVIGFGSEVARSYIGSRCQLHHNFIGDSVLEAEVNPSYGTTTANLRSDGAEVYMKIDDKKIPTDKTKLGAIVGRGVFFGVQSTTLPGVTIGAGSRIYPRSLVHKSIPEKTILKTYQKQEEEQYE